MTKPLARLIVFTVTSLLLVIPLVAAETITPVNLRCESLSDPLGIDVLEPRLSWRFGSDDSSSRAQRQSAYRILVAATEEALNEVQEDLWDSGKVPSDQSIFVRYAGKPLTSEQPCWWEVQIWDQG